jgi:hypothetical protein
VQQCLGGNAGGSSAGGGMGGGAGAGAGGAAGGGGWGGDGGGALQGSLPAVLLLGNLGALCPSLLVDHTQMLKVGCGGPRVETAVVAEPLLASIREELW